MILEKNPSSITNSIFGDRLLFGKCKIYENDRSKIIIIFIIIGWIFFSIPAFAASDLNNNVDRKTIRICELEQCLDKEATSSIIYDLINSTLLESTGKSFKTCEYSIKDNKCIQSFISFEGKGVNIFKGRGGFVGFKINDAVKNGIENIVVDIDNYPWKMGSNLNEENVERFSNQQCDSNPLSLEVSEEGFFLAIREYSCKGSVYTFTKNLILKVEEINLKSGIVIFSYYIDIQDRKSVV
jgi:hypothetical protein